MSIGRWLLTNSFFLVAFFLAAVLWLFQDELKLSYAYQQLIGAEALSTPANEVQKVVSESPVSESLVSITENPTPKTNALSQEEEKKPVEQVIVDPVSATTSLEMQEPVKAAPVDEVAETFSSSQFESTLIQARNAFWDRQYQQSIGYYKELLLQQPNRADLLGELGNVYYAVNQWDDSVSAYFQAAQRLIEQNKPEQARQLLPVITALDRAKADELKQLLYP